METPRFSVAHIGINCKDPEDARQSASSFQELFGIPADAGRDSIFSGPLLELMKANGRGTHGHIAIAADDIHAARAYLEEKGVRFAEDSCKYDSNGRLLVIYMEEEIAGFAVHLLQK